MLPRGTNIMENQVKTPIQNYFEKVLYENLTFEIPGSGSVHPNSRLPYYLFALIPIPPGSIRPDNYNYVGLGH